MSHIASNKSTQRLVIAIAADASYAEQVVTLIKSICYHHRNVHFYLLNKNFPARLGEILQEHLVDLDCEITGVIVREDFQNFKMLNHINEVSFYRFLIPELNEERILYLDSDTIVDGSLNEFFATDFGDNLAVAIQDVFINHPEISHFYSDFPNMKPYFNAGVILINNAEWRKQNILEKAREMYENNKSLVYADQDILNILLHGKWIIGDLRYNFQTSARFDLYARQMRDHADEIEQSCPNPTIIHYTSHNKAWLNHEPMLHAERWWHYYQMTWQDIKDKWASRMIL